METEFTERMEQLRNMYMTEIESQAEKMEEEKARANRGQCYNTFYSRNLRIYECCPWLAFPALCNVCE